MDHPVLSREETNQKAGAQKTCPLPLGTDNYSALRGTLGKNGGTGFRPHHRLYLLKRAVGATPTQDSDASPRKQLGML